MGKSAARMVCGTKVAMSSSGKMSQTKVSKLKSSFRLLRDTLKSTQESEIHLLGEAKRLRAELERLQAEVERTEDEGSSVEPESEVNELRQQLLQAYNELKASEDREHKTRHQLKRLWEEKQYLEKENETQPKPAELESRTKTLQDKYEDLKKDVYQRQQEVRSARKKMEALNTEVTQAEQHVKEVDERNRSLRSKKKELTGELEALRAQIDASQKECRQLLKEQEVSREDEAELVGNRGILEVKLQSVMCDRKHLYESHSVRLKETNRQCQALKRMEQALTMASEQLEHTHSVSKDLQAQLDAVSKEASIHQRMELQKDVDALRVSFEKQLSVAEEESQKMQQYGMIQGLLRESNCLRQELHNLRCLTQIKVEERGQKHRELVRAECP
ncbi:Coiled-coil domain-containing protein 146 [Liparis tanakae]|uniref:Coiled-coil domain-containing protein 146 n=1 Tax=Liparis tanakae TaxID=230148 RepID=A0A4Z2G9X0_9TELE|nr:Coiled-coil domain-containing protein 146 [Liparis tanakae]